MGLVECSSEEALLRQIPGFSVQGLVSVKCLATRSGIFSLGSNGFGTTSKRTFLALSFAAPTKSGCTQADCNEGRLSLRCVSKAGWGSDPFQTLGAQHRETQIARGLGSAQKAPSERAPSEFT